MHQPWAAVRPCPLAASLFMRSTCPTIDGFAAAAGAAGTSRMTRERRCQVKYEKAYSSSTASRLRKETSDSRWTVSHSHQATIPDDLKRPSFATARLRPIVAIAPLST